VFLAVLIFALASSIKPGPNNIMLLASGVNFGFLRTIPHMLGVTLGFFLMLQAVGLGLGTLLEAYPQSQLAMKILGGAYLLYLAWRTAMSRSMKEGDAVARPFTFLQIAAFQWVNPKAWVVALSAIALYTSVERPYLTTLLIGFAFVVVNIFCTSVWTVFGTALRNWLADPVRLKWFNIAMGVLLALTLFPLLL